MKKQKKIENWLEDRLYGLSKIIEGSIEGDWSGMVHTKWVEEVRDIINQARREERNTQRKKLAERIEDMKYKKGRRKGEIGQVTNYEWKVGYNSALEDIKQLLKQK